MNKLPIDSRKFSPSGEAFGKGAAGLNSGMEADVLLPSTIGCGRSPDNIASRFRSLGAEPSGEGLMSFASAIVSGRLSHSRTLKTHKSISHLRLSVDSLFLESPMPKQTFAFLANTWHSILFNKSTKIKVKRWINYSWYLTTITGTEFSTLLWVLIIQKLLTSIFSLNRLCISNLQRPEADKKRRHSDSYQQSK